MAKRKSTNGKNAKERATARSRSGSNLEQKVTVASYEHPTARVFERPAAGFEPEFRKKRPVRTYRYDSSLSPELNWDGQNPAREQGEAALARMRAMIGNLEARVKALPTDAAGERRALSDALAVLRHDVEHLIALGRPFLNWAGKAERLSFDVPTLPLFVHERQTTEAIIASLKAHRRDEQSGVLSLDLFGDEQRSITNQLIGAYEHQNRWVNRMILGDSLAVMNSLLEYEGLGGQVQMIYLDPPYGVKFGSNFQPFVRNRDVKNNDDAVMTREPETVRAYRDTWELGLHSYLSYLRDRFFLARELLSTTGSIFVQISRENVHHIRETLDEVFGHSNFCGQIEYATTSSQTAELLAATSDYVLWYAKAIEYVKFRPLFVAKKFEEIVRTTYNKLELPDGSIRAMTSDEMAEPSKLPKGVKILSLGDLTSRSGSEATTQPFRLHGKIFRPKSGGWKTHAAGLERLAASSRLHVKGESILYKRYYSDFPFTLLSQSWPDTQLGGFVKTEEKLYVVQTPAKVIARCLLMTTDPGDLVIDPTCGSGTTAHVAEQWGRRWITIDTSRVPLALARQRMLSATYDWFELRDARVGPSGGFVYKRRQNNKGEDVGGIVPHVTLKSIANDEPPHEEVLVDRPEVARGRVRVAGPFVLEATIAGAIDIDGDGTPDVTRDEATDHAAYVGRMIAILRRTPVLHLTGNQRVTLHGVRPPARSSTVSADGWVEAITPGQQPSLEDVVSHAEAQRGDMLDLSRKPVAILFGPEHAAVSERLVFDAAREARAKNYTHLYVIGFSIQPNASELIERCDGLMGMPATYIQAAPDLAMADLLKQTRASQIFSVVGRPDAVTRARNDGRWEVELRGVDTFDPVTMEARKLEGNDTAAWFLDVAWDGRVFHVSQAFFPRTRAWDALKRDLRADFAESLWEHLAGTVSTPFDGKKGDKVAVKVIDDRGNELLRVLTLGQD